MLHSYLSWHQNNFLFSFSVPLNAPLFPSLSLGLVLSLVIFHYQFLPTKAISICSLHLLCSFYFSPCWNWTTSVLRRKGFSSASATLVLMWRRERRTYIAATQSLAQRVQFQNDVCVITKLYLYSLCVVMKTKTISIYSSTCQKAT